MYQIDPPRPPQETMPKMYDLPSELVGKSGLERQRAERLAEYLRSQGVDPNNLP